MIATAQDIAGQMGEKREAEGSKCADAAFEELYLANYVRIVGVLCRLVGDRTRAEELANDVFWRLYRQRLLLDRDGNVAGWLYRTARFVALEAIRAQKRRQKHYEEFARMNAPDSPDSLWNKVAPILEEVVCWLRRVGAS